jgi:acyl-CoA thioesterase-1
MIVDKEMQGVIQMKTVLFGDSISKGIVTDDGTLKTIKNSATNLIAAHFGKPIDNLSQYGQTIKRLWEKGTVDQYIASIETDEDRFAIIGLGGNDSDYRWEEVAINPWVDHPSKTPIEEFTLLYDSLIKHLKKNGFKVIVFTIFPIDSERFFDNVITKLADPEKIRLFMRGDIHTIGRHQEAFNIAVLKCAYENHCRIIDIRSRILVEPEYHKYLCMDGIHPNEAGYQLIAHFVIEEIEHAQDLSEWVGKQPSRAVKPVLERNNYSFTEN